MNTRIQVEHPVTEMVTGRDLVVEQIRIAAGEPISFTQSDVTASTGHAIECRINAEDATRTSRRDPAGCRAWAAPTGEGRTRRYALLPGYLVPPFYDSLLAKVIAYGVDREEAVERMQAALERFEVAGVPTTIPFHRQVLAHADFRAGRVTTRWVEQEFLGAETPAAVAGSRIVVGPNKEIAEPAMGGRSRDGNGHECRSEPRD